MMINIFLLLFFSTYYLSVLFFLRGLFFDNFSKNSSTPFISVIIALKNEQKNLPTLINGLKKQDYPADKFEVLLIDNESDDSTYEGLLELTEDLSNFTCYSTIDYKSDLKYKKEALMMGIEKSKGEIILSTDADCQMSTTWISGFAQNYHDDVDMVIGFSQVDANTSFFQKFQKFDFMMLMAAAKGAINSGFPWGGSGQNISFRKSGFFKCDGYSNLKTLKGGDDTLFIQKFAQHNSGKIIFANNQETWVKTHAVPKLGTFIRQRIRWASEANYTRNFNLVVFFISLATFVANAGLVFLLIQSLFIPSQQLWFLGLLMGKALVEFFLALSAAKTFHINGLMHIFIPWNLIYPPYALFLGIMSFFGHNVKWK